MAAVDDRFIKGRAPALTEPFEPVTGLEREIAPGEQQYEQTGGSLFEGGIVGTPDEFDQAIDSLRGLRDTLHRVENPDLYEPKAQQHDRNMFKSALFNQFGGNPFMRNVADEARSRFNKELKDLWNHFFQGRIPWGGKLTRVQAKEWAALQETFYADIYNEIKAERDDQIEAFKYSMGEFDRRIESERADERLAIANAAEERLQAEARRKAAERDPAYREARLARETQVKEAAREPFVRAREERAEKRKISGEQRKQERVVSEDERKAQLKREEEVRKEIFNMFTKPGYMWDKAEKSVKDSDLEGFGMDIEEDKDLKVAWTQMTPNERASNPEARPKYIKERFILETKIGPWVERAYPSTTMFEGKPRYTKYMEYDPQWGWSWFVGDHKEKTLFIVAAQDVGWLQPDQQLNLGSLKQR